MFRLVSYGLVLKEATSRDKHRKNRDHVAALEKALAEAMTAAGYEVMNTVNCRTKLDVEAFASVRAAFAAHFTQLTAESARTPGNELAGSQRNRRGIA